MIADVAHIRLVVVVIIALVILVGFVVLSVLFLWLSRSSRVDEAKESLPSITADEQE